MNDGEKREEKEVRERVKIFLANFSYMNLYGWKTHKRRRIWENRYWYYTCAVCVMPPVRPLLPCYCSFISIITKVRRGDGNAAVSG